ncbi:MAG: nuclear transport factor 2 family protein [Actinomycetota bacterium]|nr:nuclear transport factor 2 family protein [Actinomycetota bacterium]
MSQENVQVVRRSLDAAREGDLQGAVRGFHADAVWHNTAEFPGQRTCVGPQAIIEFWETLQSSGKSGGWMHIEGVVSGDDSVVLGVHSLGRGRASGGPVDLHWVIAFQVRGGKISRVDVHGDWAKALEAVGLRE